MVMDIIFFTFINDDSCKTWMCMLKAKSRVFQKYHCFHATVENETCMQSSALRTNNRTEYISNECEENCRKHGIHYEKEEPDTSQHNGVVERMNKPIVEKVGLLL